MVDTQLMFLFEILEMAKFSSEDPYRFGGKWSMATSFLQGMVEAGSNL